MKRLLTVCCFLVGVAPIAWAGDGDIGPVFIEHLSVIAIPTGGHAAGNMEIKIENGFVLPAGVTCDKNHITTKKVNDPDRAMLSLLLQAHNSRRPVRLRITDNSVHEAFTGRCSLALVTLN